MKKLLLNLLLMLTATTGWAWDGSGTSDDPYLITNAEDLTQLATDVNGGNSYSGKYFEMTNDIQFTGGSNNFTSIGGYLNGDYKYFSGHFDGKGNKVSGINIEKGGINLSDCFQGLFGCIKTEGNNIAEVKNIILDGSTIQGSMCCGGIVGDVKSGTVENCHVKDDVTIKSILNTDYYHGGIVGFNEGGSVTGCTSAAQITASSNAGDFFGGIVGQNKGTVSDCFYYGGAIGGNHVATIAAQNNGTVRNCYSTRVYINGHQIKIADGGTVENCGIANIITLDPGVTCSGNALTVGGFTLATEGQTVNLGYTGTVPEGYVLIYTANNGTISGNATSGYTLTVYGDGRVTATVTPTSGNCGTTDHEADVTWTMTDEDHDDIYETITISGTGEMADYNYYEQPWVAFRKLITTVIIEDGVTAIGSNAFTVCTSLSKAYILPTTVPATSSNVFDGCSNLSKIVVPAKARDSYWNNWYYDNNYSYATYITKGYTINCAEGITATGEYNGPLVIENEPVTIDYKVPSVAPEGYEAPFVGYRVKGYNIDQTVTEDAGKYTFQMPDCYVTVMPAWTAKAWSGYGTKDSPYIIEYASQLDLLASNVNGFTDYTDYTDTYFELGQDIEYSHITNWDDAASTENNYTPIGIYVTQDAKHYNSRIFNGHFDGKGHRISGLRNYNETNGQYSCGYRGVFGKIGTAGSVSGVILDDTRITGYYIIGGIAGQNDGTISDCHVTDHVNIYINISDNNATYYGGIAGLNGEGTISGCTSAVSITSKIVQGTGISTPTSYHVGSIIGGIAGSNKKTIKDCLYLGSTLEGKKTLGAIVGHNIGALENCFYTSTTLQGMDMEENDIENAQSTLGGSGNDATATNCGLALGGNLDYNAFLAVMAARTAALTAVERKPALNTDVALTYKRSFTQDKASTVCLPFDYTPDDQDGHFFTFVGITKENDQYIATMKENTVKALAANTPYLFMPAATGEVDFSGDYTITASTDAPATTSDEWTFMGTYARLTYGTEPMIGHVYGFASKTKDVDGVTVQAGEFVHAKEGASVPPMRCYLIYKDGEQFSGVRAMTRGEVEVPESIIVRFVNSRGETTAIGELDTNTGEVTIDREGWYDLNGRRLPSKPTKKGLYINNGQKIVIK